MKTIEHNAKTGEIKVFEDGKPEIPLPAPGESFNYKERFLALEAELKTKGVID